MALEGLITERRSSRPGSEPFLDSLGGPLSRFLVPPGDPSSLAQAIAGLAIGERRTLTSGNAGEFK